MKKIYSILLIFSGFAFGQIETPQPSPLAKIEQVVGLTDVAITYSRPAVRNRSIMGDLVPYGEMWRAGANANTTIEFSDEVKIRGQKLASGKYAIFIRPGVSMWEVFFYTKTDNGGLPDEWDPKAVALVVESTVDILNKPIECFTISIENLHQNGATLNFSWENTQASLELSVPTEAKTMASIDKTMKGTPKSRDYYNAAVYYREVGKDLDKAKQWIAKAIEMDDGKYWIYRQQALILIALNETDAAIEASKTSLKLATEAGNQDYIRINNKAIAEWSK
jgi:tetratricopeptide (TPR) repeat protein|tara:strand:- start:16998 stop:17834 length:837 start_codon:yes stop_codon:yes gene_type:complete